MRLPSDSALAQILLKFLPMVQPARLGAGVGILSVFISQSSLLSRAVAYLRKILTPFAKRLGWPIQILDQMMMKKKTRTTDIWAAPFRAQLVKEVEKYPINVLLVLVPSSSAEAARSETAMTSRRRCHRRCRRQYAHGALAHECRQRRHW